MFGHKLPRVTIWPRVTILPRVTLLGAELLEDASCQDPVNDGVTFYVRYLGCCGVPRWVTILTRISNIVAKKCKFYVIRCVSRPSGEEVTAEAIKSIIQAVNYTLSQPLIKSNMLLSGTHIYSSLYKKQYFFISPCLYPCLDYFPLSAHRTKNIFNKHSQTSQTRNLLLLQNWTFTSFVRLRKRE